MVNEAFKNQIGKGIDSTEKARELGALGGKKSGESKRRKRDIKQNMRLAFDIITEDMIEDAKKSQDESKASLLEQIGSETFELISIIQDPSVKLETKLAALKEAYDRMYGKPTQSIISDNRNINVNDITEEERDIAREYARKMLSQEDENKSI
jgi:hypothetical protein